MSHFMKFFPSDWRAEPKLRLVSRAARSLWIDMLGLMFEAGTGRLEVQGAPMTIEQLAQMLGDNPRTTRKLLAEIEGVGLSSRDREGFIISRRIIRDFEKAEADKLNGRKGGNPSLKTTEKDQSEVNPPVNTHIPEARNQIEEGGGGSAREAEIAHPPGPDLDPHEEILIAAGVDPKMDVTGKWHSSEQIGEADRWRTDLNLSHPEILTTIGEVMSSRSATGPPGNLRYFTSAMQRTAGRRDAPKLEPIGGSDHGQSPTRASRSTRNLDAFLSGARG